MPPRRRSRNQEPPPPPPQPNPTQQTAEDPPESYYQQAGVEDNWAPFYPPHSYEYGIRITESQHNNVFTGVATRIMPYQNAENQISRSSSTTIRDLHLISLQNESEVSMYRNITQDSGPYTFTPYLNLDTRHDDAFQGTSVAIGRNVGVPILSWFRMEGRELYDYLGYRTVGEDWRKLGRWLGAALYREHSDDRFVGNLLTSTFVDERNQKVRFIKDPQSQSQRLVDGMVDDLKQLHRLVLWVESEYPVNTTASNRNLVDLDTYKNHLYPGDQTLDYHASNGHIDKLKEWSYILCHNFLYFESDQRFLFCSTYRRMRQMRLPHFDTEVWLDGALNISDNWHNILTHGGVFDTIRKHQLAAHQKKHGLIHFFRSCKWHYNEQAVRMRCLQLSEKELDKELSRMFPSAIPFVFTALFTRSTIPTSEVIDALKEDGLHYV